MKFLKSCSVLRPSTFSSAQMYMLWSSSTDVLEVTCAPVGHHWQVLRESPEINVRPNQQLIMQEVFMHSATEKHSSKYGAVARNTMFFVGEPAS